MARSEMSRFRVPDSDGRFEGKRPFSGNDWAWLFRSGNNEGPYVENQGMVNLDNWQDFYNNRRKFTNNPYGHALAREGRTPVDDLRRKGFRMDDPSGWGWLQRRFDKMRGPHNPQGKQSPWNMNKYYDHPTFGVMTPRALRDMTRPEQVAYGRKRFTYDNNLRGGLSDENSYARARRLAEAGTPVAVGGVHAGNYDKYGNLNETGKKSKEAGLI